MTTRSLPGLAISGNRRHLTLADGSPFFWLGDTAWELFHRLNREEAELYLRSRAADGFNVIQAVALAELDGLTTGNAYGKLPLLKNEDGSFDPERPDLAPAGEYGYWEHVDYIVDLAAELGLYIGLLPTWGDKFHVAWGKGPDIFDPDNARAYGRWIGERYRDRSNIVWIMGGDRPLHELRHFAIVRAMAEGVREGSAGRQLMTFHPHGGVSSSLHVHHEPWLDFNMLQSSHGSQYIANYDMIAKDYARTPTKPTLDGEPCYEDIPIGFKLEKGFFDAADVRKAAYWAVFAGAFGHTYGHHAVWSMTKEPEGWFTMSWRQALTRPGAGQMKHVRRLLESRPFEERVPDQSLLVEAYTGASHLQAARGQGYAFIYSPSGLPFEVHMGRLTGDTVQAAWYDPRTGETTPACRLPNTGTARFTPPSSGRNDDWVLILDDAALGYAMP
ncbi:glycoside hydrolase family 140 protein [Paenibacillus sp. 1P07SE]|uniref:glycoside hydrolase family 140 protein n=1 Tax=Paenibacillus sp. 1P07SE TaxID=3132209 RepID=UPI0039A51CAB